jgi:hypothetical protein
MRKFTFILVGFLNVICFGADIYVNHTGSATPPYDTEAKASTDIQVALDAASSGDTVRIKADANYVMNGVDQQAAQFDLDVNHRVTTKGYYLTPGDQDYGGAYYKDPDHGWAVINANNGNFNVFGIGTKSYLKWQNLKITNVASTKNSFELAPPTQLPTGYVIQNCWITGGCRAIQCTRISSIQIQDCKFTGTYGTSVTDAVVYSSSNTDAALIESCEFTHGNANESIRFVGYGGYLICNNIFNISGTVVSVMNLSYTAFAINNTIYKNSGGSISKGINFTTWAGTSAALNNIIAGCTTSINEEVTINFGGWNCFYNNGSDWTLRAGDIVADPQFVDAANGDFRLKPTSPCLNAGKPTLNNGKTTIGAWQPASYESVPSGDLNNDFRVDFYDFAKMASDWLIDCTTDPNDPACVPK